MKIVRCFLNKIKVIFFIAFIIIGCSPNGSSPAPESKGDVKKIEDIIKQQDKQIAEIQVTLDSHQGMITDQSKVIDRYGEVNANNSQSRKELNEVQIALTRLQKGGSVDQDFFNTLNKMQKKLQILEDRTFYTDSLYFEIVSDLVMIENKISSLISSYKEMNELSGKKKTKVIPKITNEEYTAKYIESLSQYQNGEWNLSLDGFKFLIQADSNHDLADNCQYWIGEVYYALTDYRRSMKEFEKIFTFPGTNKADDAQFKLGLCYINIGQVNKAKQEFENLLEFYPNSEYYKRSQEYLRQY